MKISVIIPVYHEEGTINPCLDALKQVARGAALEIILVDGASGAGTLMAAGGGVIKISAPKGRAKQMNTGAKAAVGDVLLFLHADTVLPAGAFGAIEQALADGSAGAGAFRLAIDTKNPLLKFIQFTANLRTKVFRMPYGDQAFFFRKNYFEELGGYRDIPIMEDAEIMKRIRKNGGKIAVIDAPATTSARRWQKEGIIYASLRNKAVGALFRLGVPAEKLSRYYG